MYFGILRKREFFEKTNVGLFWSPFKKKRFLYPGKACLEKQHRTRVVGVSALPERSPLPAHTARQNHFLPYKEIAIAVI